MGRPARLLRKSAPEVALTARSWMRICATCGIGCKETAVEIPGVLDGTRALKLGFLAMSRRWPWFNSKASNSERVSERAWLAESGPLLGDCLIGLASPCCRVALPASFPTSSTPCPDIVVLGGRSPLAPASVTQRARQQAGVRAASCGGVPQRMLRFGTGDAVSMAAASLEVGLDQRSGGCGAGPRRVDGGPRAHRLVGGALRPGPETRRREGGA